MASGRNSVMLLCVCSVLLFLILADDVAAYGQHRQGETGVVGSTEELHLRGNTATNPKHAVTERVLVEAETEFEEFVRRELDQYPLDPADPNCDNDPSLCP